MNKFLEILQNETPEAVGTTRAKNIDTNGIFYHVIQQTDNRTTLFSADAARYRDGLMKTISRRLGIIPIANVIMPTHTHDIFLTEDVYKISILLRNVNRGTSVFIRNERERKFNQKLHKVFTEQPGYVVIKNRQQFFCLLKYLYDNPAFLKSRGDFVPYSCFDSWEKGYTKPYKTEIIDKLFGISVEKLLDLCKILPKEEFRNQAFVLFGKDNAEFSDKMFKKDTTKPWLQG